MADRGYFSGEEILACEQAGITVTLPKPMTSGAKSDGRYVKQDFVYLPDENVYRCPAGERLEYRFTNVENGLSLRRSISVFGSAFLHDQDPFRTFEGTPDHCPVPSSG